MSEDSGFGFDLDNVVADNEDAIPIGLLLADEIRRLRETKEQGAKEIKPSKGYTVVIDRENESYSSSFKVDDLRHPMPIEATGKLEYLVLITNKPSYVAQIRVDGEYVINQSYNKLSEVTTELSDITTYQKTTNMY